MKNEGFTMDSPMKNADVPLQSVSLPKGKRIMCEKAFWTHHWCEFHSMSDDFSVCFNLETEKCCSLWPSRCKNKVNLAQIATFLGWYHQHHWWEIPIFNELIQQRAASGRKTQVAWPMPFFPQSMVNHWYLNHIKSKLPIFEYHQVFSHLLYFYSPSYDT